MQKQAVLFDLDNTLYHYDPCNEAGLEAAWKTLSNRHRITSHEFQNRHDIARAELARELAGQAASHNRTLFFKRIVEMTIGRSELPLTLELTECYWKSFLKRMRPGPETSVVLDKLAKTHRLALVSNQTTEIQLRKLVTLGIDSYFGAIITSEEVGAEKPDVKVFDAALAALDVSASEAILVGDHLRGDIAGAQKAGVATIHTREFTSDHDRTIQPDFTMERLGELLKILD